MKIIERILFHDIGLYYMSIMDVQTFILCLSELASNKEILNTQAVEKMTVERIKERMDMKKCIFC